jgi:hypothetical protein
MAHSRSRATLTIATAYRRRPMRLLRFYLATSISLAASACAVGITDAMRNLEGQPLSALVAKLGPPLEERTISGMTVFTWGMAGIRWQRRSESRFYDRPS